MSAVAAWVFGLVFVVALSVLVQSDPYPYTSRRFELTTCAIGVVAGICFVASVAVFIGGYYS